MKILLQLLVLAAVFCTTAVAEDELDIALAAQKKKARHRTYSTAAILQHENLVVPAELTAEEKSLEDKVRAMDKKINSNPATFNRRTMVPRNARATPRQPEEPNNWLTPALFDNDVSGVDSANQDASTWITQELDRQKLIQMEKNALKKNVTRIHQPLHGETQPTERTQYNPFKSYDSAFQHILSGSTQGTRRNTSSGISRTAPKKTTIGISSYLKPNSSAPIDSPKAFSSVIKQRHRTTQFGILPSQSPAKPTSIWDTPSAKPLSPLKRLRQRTPLNADPFTEDYMPKTKKSIWD